MRLVRDVREQFTGVQKGDRGHAGWEAGESPVIAAAAAAQPMTFVVGGEGGDDGYLRGGDGVGAEVAGHGLVEAARGEAKGMRAVVGSPVEVQVGENDGQEKSRRWKRGSEAIGEGGAAGLGRYRQVAADHAVRVPPHEENELLEERVGRGEKPLGRHARPCGKDLGTQRAFLKSDAHVAPSIAQR